MVVVQFAPDDRHRALFGYAFLVVAVFAAIVVLVAMSLVVLVVFTLVFATTGVASAAELPKPARLAVTATAAMMHRVESIRSSWSFVEPRGPGPLATTLRIRRATADVGTASSWQIRVNVWPTVSRVKLVDEYVFTGSATLRAIPCRPVLWLVATLN